MCNLEQEVCKVESISKQETQKLEALKADIDRTEKEIDTVKSELNAFRLRIRTELRVEIAQIQKLQALYNEQKKLKKEKRREQKRKGKNFRTKENTLVSKQQKETRKSCAVNENLNELKRLYKEGVVKVHPDKIQSNDDDEIKQATELTILLNEHYQNANLEQLRRLHQQIFSGLTNLKLDMKVDHNEKIWSLKVELRDLKFELEELQASQLYVVLRQLDKEKYLSDLRNYFHDKINKLRKRTRSR
ncbi:hypothetical protein [Aureibacter tunicatorum]|uniref:Chromosome segregation ATPase n=1 Tax=Aureibacter tunicatorum TaxID=866807 RepID=A0AAE3XGH5_9BACT|nr:hypothetical protein [Aureibacter tunicatorum]MDR6237186.1 chromosome segregation ATPase [Aureibacter tunicatorum]BDD06178.1 hypothetical protein AUTU_36610 [Aureibacter tunicatorum]